MSKDNFDHDDRQFLTYRQKHPEATYAQYSVQNQLNHVNAGKPHPTLGPKLVRWPDWWEAGRPSFDKFCKLFGICSNARLLDYGCGSLRLGGHFIRYLDPGCYFGIDVLMGFVDHGKALVGEALLNEKRPYLGEINEQSLADGIGFGADFVMSTACAFQVHPSDKAVYVSNLKRLTHRPGATLFFDTKIADEHFRFRSSSWAWPLDYYIEAFAPMKLVEAHHWGDKEVNGRSVASKILEFRRNAG